jgi:hypothetical protein
MQNTVDSISIFLFFKVKVFSTEIAERHYRGVVTYTEPEFVNV